MWIRLSWKSIISLKFEHEWAVFGWWIEWGTVNIIYIGTSHNNNTNSFSYTLLNSGLAAMKETLWFMIVAPFSHSWPFRKGQCMCARMCCVSFPCSTWLWGQHHGRGLSFPWQPCKRIVKRTKVWMGNVPAVREDFPPQVPVRRVAIVWYVCQLCWFLHN